MFEQHPHFAIFPGDAVEIMPVLPIRGMSMTGTGLAEPTLPSDRARLGGLRRICVR